MLCGNQELESNLLFRMLRPLDNHNVAHLTAEETEGFAEDAELARLRAYSEGHWSRDEGAQCAWSWSA